ncbi:hypothetical protein IMSAG049_00485 [Clostridiales bacterium]|nr:hypothetical protein IMSAG049_00485 [Clostridiales bacterium]
MDRIKTASEMLKNADYEGKAQRSAKGRCVCHNAFKNDNIRMSENGEMTVSGLDSCTYGVCASDLAQLIRRYIKSDLADEAGVADIIDSYRSERPITDGEMEIIRGLLVYPYKFLKLCNEHYNKRRVCISEAAVERFENCAKCGDREMKFAMSI